MQHRCFQLLVLCYPSSIFQGHTRTRNFYCSMSATICYCEYIYIHMHLVFIIKRLITKRNIYCSEWNAFYYSFGEVLRSVCIFKAQHDLMYSINTFVFCRNLSTFAFTKKNSCVSYIYSE